MNDAKEIKRLLFLVFRFFEIEKELEQPLDNIFKEFLFKEKDVIYHMIREDCFEFMDELNSVCVPMFDEIEERYRKRS